MTTTSTQLLSRVRSNINEPSAAQRTDAEIYQWLDEGLFDYMHKVPQEHFPELTTSKTFTGSAVGLPTDYMFFHSCTVNHTLSGTYTGVDDCYVVPPGDSYLPNFYPCALGAWCQITGNTLSCGPQIINGTLTYVKTPTHLSTASATLDIGAEHETPIVNYGTMMALLKINDADADAFKKLYDDNVAAKVARKESGEIERA